MNHRSHRSYQKRATHTVKGAIVAAVWAIMGLTAGSAVFASAGQPQMIASSGSLPVGVTTAAQSIISLQRIKYDLPAGKTGEASARSQQANGLYASGVVIDGTTVLTAAHAVNDNGRLACGRTSIDVASVDAAHAATRHMARLGNAAYGNGKDIALLKVDPGQDLSELPKVHMANAAPKKGDIVYFVNYQPTADGATRSPAAALSKPAIFRGVVVGYNQNGYSIATNLDSKSHDSSDTILRKGGSGGAVLNDKGELVALSVSIDSLSPRRNANDLAKNYDVHLPNGKYQLTKAQRVDRSTVKALQASLISCE